METLIHYKPDEHFFGWLSSASRGARAPSRPDYVEAPLPVRSDAHPDRPPAATSSATAGSFGARFRLVSGNPRKHPRCTYGFYDESARGARLGVTALTHPQDSCLLLDQLDMRVDKTWKFRTWKLGAYIDAQNVYNHEQRAKDEGYNFNYTKTSFVHGPALPAELRAYGRSSRREAREGTPCCSPVVADRDRGRRTVAVRAGGVSGQGAS